MAAITAEAFRKLSLMAGTARSLQTEPLTDEDINNWERDFAIICDDLSRIVDPELGNDLRGEKAFYDEAVKVAKAYFDQKPLGGLKAAPGQYGFRLIGPQDLKTDATGETPAYYSWIQTISIGSGYTYKDYAIGASSHTAALYVRNAANKKAVLAFHRLISFKPSPRIIHVAMNINDFPYVPYSVEPFSKIDKQNKLFKIIPMPGRVLIHPGGKFYIKLFFDNEGGESLGTGFSVDIEVAPFGLVFGEYDYLASEELK